MERTGETHVYKAPKPSSIEIEAIMAVIKLLMMVGAIALTALLIYFCAH